MIGFATKLYSETGWTLSILEIVALEDDSIAYVLDLLYKNTGFFRSYNLFKLRSGQFSLHSRRLVIKVQPEKSWETYLADVEAFLIKCNELEMDRIPRTSLGKRTGTWNL